MARYVLFGLALLALCALAAAEFWPAGIKGAEQLEELSAGPSQASIAAAKSYGSSKYKSAKKKYSNHYSSKHDKEEKEYDDDEDEKSEYKSSHKKYGSSHKPSHAKSKYGYGKEDYEKPHKKKHVKPLPPGKYPKGYATAPPGTGPKDDDEWFEGDGDYNKPYDHADEHDDDCIGSRHVAVTGPANAGGLCPPQSTLFDAQVCDVPAFCGPNGSPFINPQAPCACPEGEFLRFDAGYVQDHFKNQPGPFQMVDVTRHTYECVDARGSGPMLGTPGGDLAELMAAAMAVMKLTGQKYSQAIADEVFDLFTDEVASEERPLYFHTDDGSLRRLFRSLAGKLSTGRKPSIFPWKGPSGSDGEAWLNALKAAEFNGCGHIRLMIAAATTGFYSAQVAGETITACGEKLTPDTCIDAGALAQRIIEKFFRYWWFTDSGSEEREKVAFAVDGILEGPLLGKAVTIIQNAGPEADACPGHAPLVDPSFGASQVFVYHGAAVLQWRAFVGEEYFDGLAEKYGFTTDQFISTWTDIANMQLGATLTYLEPANRVGQFVVDVPIKDVSDYVKVGEEEEYDSYYKDTDSNGYYKAPYKPYKDGYEAPPPKYGYEAPAPKYGYKAPPPKYGYTPPSPKYDYDAPPPKYGYEGPPKYRR